MSKNGSPRRVQFYKDKMGQRQYTLNALREMVEDQFSAETSGRADILQELDTREKRIAAVTEAADYVLAHEYVNLPANEKRRIVEEAVANLFYFGSLDPYLRDENYTEITIEGPLAVHVRRGFGELSPVTSPFDNLAHLERILTTMIAPTGTFLSGDYPFVEVGLWLHDRPVRLSLIAPPVSPMYSIQLRLHPVKALPLDALIPEMIPPAAADLLKQILTAGKGLLVTGEVGVGKTTLIAALLNALPDMPQVVSVERAQEMQLRDGVTRLAAVPHQRDAEPQDFAAQIIEAMEHHSPRALVMDEIRGDESEAFWIAVNDVPQPIVAFRGTSSPERLLSALSMVIRKHQFSLESETISAVIQEKLPFVAALHHYKNNPLPRLSMLGQWVSDSGGLKLQPLVTWGADDDPQRSEAALNL